MEQMHEYGFSPAINSSAVIEAIYKDCLIPNVPSAPVKELRDAVRQFDSTFVFASEAIDRYLEHLGEQGVLKPERVWAGKSSALIGWRVSDNAAIYFRKRGGELAQRNEREERAERGLRSLLDRLPKEETAGFSLDRWRTEPIASVGARLAEVIEAGGEGWRKFISALEAIARMLRDGPAVHETLGLPIEGEIARAAERERLKQEEAARLKREAEEKATRDRAAWLTQDAIGGLGAGRGRAWLDERLEGETRLAIASVSDRALADAQHALGVARRRQDEEDRREREAADCRQQLREAALKAFDAERAELFLRSTQPRLGMSPWSRCINRQGLNECLALLPGASPRRAIR